MQAFKAAKRTYAPLPELLNLLEDFRKIVNDCICIGLAENVTSMKALSRKAYPELAKYGIPTYCYLTAISKAADILRNYRHMISRHPKVKKPHASKLMLIECYGFKITNGKLRPPIRAREYVYTPLNACVLRSVEGRHVAVT